MFGFKILEEISGKIGDTLSGGPAKDLEKNIKAVLGGAFSKADLVTREEFDIQQQILIKTRIRLTELEARLAELEAARSPAPDGDGTGEGGAA
ncbi:MAG: accessory factor UbiK family protein [Neisseria sp.]|nr:accessory factor UbiK family protein [Neisseria sp.]